MKKLETVEVEEESMRHVLDAFLFCCYTGLRYSDFCQLTPENFIRINGKRWLYFTSIKTGVELRLPLHLLFESRALGILDRYPDIGSFAALPCNSEVNKQLRKLAGLCGIKKRITYHVRSHSKFFYLLNISELSILKNVTANDLETSYILFLSQLCNIQRTL